MNFKPVERKKSNSDTIKLQHTKDPIIGEYVEQSKSKMGSNIYHIKNDVETVKIYGFKDLDEQMAAVDFFQLVKITYKNCYNIPTGGTKHFAKVEISNDIDENGVEEAVEPSISIEKDHCDTKHSIQNIQPSVEVKKCTSEAFKEIMAKIQANKTR